MKKIICLLTAAAILTFSGCMQQAVKKDAVSQKHVQRPAIHNSGTPSLELSPPPGQSRETRMEEFHEHLVMADKSLNDGDYDNALKLFQKAREIDRESSAPLNGIARVYLIKRDMDKALEYFDRSLMTDPQNPYNYLGKAEVYTLKSDYERAASEYEKALEIAPDNTDCIFGMGKIHSLNFEYKKAEDLYSRAIEKNPDIYVYVLFRSFSRIKQNKFEEARVDAEKIMKQKPELITPYLALAEIEEFTGNPEKAMVFYNKAIELEKKNSSQMRFNFGHRENPLIGRAMVYFDTGRPQKALKDLEKAYKDPVNPKDSAVIYMAEVYMSIGEKEKARKLAKKWFKMDPEDLEHYNKYDRTVFDAIGMAVLGEHEKALKKINEGIKQGPTEFLFDRAKIYYFAGDYEKSKDDLLKHLKQYPNSTESILAKNMLKKCNKKLEN